MVNRNAKNGYKIVKKDHINVACELSLNNGQKYRKPVFMRVSSICFIKWL